jgi:S1-C subfamily serine protease
MVTEPMMFGSPEPATSPVTSPPPEDRGPGRRRTAVIAAVFVIGGLAGGAIGAELIMNRTQPAAPVAARTASSSATGATAAPAISAAAVYQQAAPGVVTISTVAGRFGRAGEGTGSGIVLNSNGDILTNAHVVAGANQVRVTFKDGKTLDASVTNSDASADLAVVHVSGAGSSLHPLALGNSDSVLVGDTAYAIGAPFGLAESMTEGIVSGLNRTDQATGLTGLIQTDAPINPGNSGGPLLNAQGDVIGVNDSIESPVAGNVGVGFAIPINVVKRLLGSLEGGANQ